MTRFTGKKILVTGASRGIGKSIALQLALEGATVAIHYHYDTGEAEAVEAAAKEAGGKVFLLQADLSDARQATELGRQAWDILNGMDYLVNNAGVCYKKHFLDATMEDVDYFTNINYKGTLFLTQAVAKKMVASQKAGSIYTITSINGIQPGVGLSVYGASKGALETLMKGIALELAPHHINVNTLAIGAVQTAMNEDSWKDESKLQLVNENIPLGRLGQPEEIAAMICDLLLSGTYMTGATITIDGGWVLKHGYINPKPYENK